MEASETLTRAEDTARYFANPPDGRRVSAHYCADADSVVQCVDLDDSAWTVGNRPGNMRGINWEFSGFARQTRADWLDPFSLAMFRRAAPIIRSDAKRFGIPLTRRSVDELRAFEPGVTSHGDLGVAFGGTTHTDPGSNFPWDEFLKIVNNLEAGTMFMFLVEGDDAWHVSDGQTRRPLPSNAETRVRDILTRAGAVNLGVLPVAGGASIKEYAEIVGGPLVNGGGSGTPPTTLKIELSGTATP
jgi:hypothetical protein